MLRYVSQSADDSIITKFVDESSCIVLEKGIHQEWEVAAASPNLVQYVAPEQVPSVPQVISRFQAKAALYSVGLLDKVEAALAADGNFIHQLAWNEAVEFRRDSPTISHIARAIELDEQSIDDLFRLALSIRA